MRMDLDDETPNYCGPELEDVRTSFLKIHFPLLLTAFVVGAVGNLSNVVVLTRPRLRSPVTVTLAVLALAHLVLLVETLVVTVNHVPQLQNSSFLMSVWFLVHINSVAVLHFFARCLVTVALVWSVYDSFKPRNSKHATVVSITAFFASICVHIPLFISFNISQEYQDIYDEGNLVFDYNNDTNLNSQNDTPVFYWTFSDIATNNEYILVRVNEYIYGVAFIIAPCLISFILTILKLRRSKCQHQSLQANCNESIETRTLLFISTLSIITDLPLSVLNLMKTLLDQEFVSSCVHPLNEVMEVMTLVFPVTTVFIYCKKSKLYWSTFVVTFKPNFLTRWWPNSLETTVTTEEKSLLM